jgi:hypothetical protein
MKSWLGTAVCPICYEIVEYSSIDSKFWTCSNSKCPNAEGDHDTFELAFTNENDLREIQQKREIEFFIEEVHKKIVTLLRAELMELADCPICGQIVGLDKQLRWTCENKECPNSVRKRDWVDLIKNPKEVNQNDENSD